MYQPAQLDSTEIERLLGQLPPALMERLRESDASEADACAEAAAFLQRELLAFVALIPAPLVREQLANPMPGRVSGAYWHGSVLFADLSGFTALSERLSALGKQGAEEISAIVNRLFAALVEEVHRFSGAPLKFGGDAMTAFFDATQLGEEHAALASSAALAMQRRMAAFSAVETPVGCFRLQLRVGVHSGRIFAAQVGDQSHIELVISGSAINEVALAQEVAEPGEVVVSAATLALLAPFAEPRSAERNTGFSVLHDLPSVALPSPSQALVPPLPAHPDKQMLLHLSNQLAALRPYLMYNLPRRYVEVEDVAMVGEFRPVSILFANFSSFSDILNSLGEATELAAQVLNAYYRRAQAVIHSYGGVVNKVDMSTSGDKLMALFGAPVAHEDDPTRAVRCALDLAKALDEANQEIALLLSDGVTNRAATIQSPSHPVTLSQKIGINTGTVFAGRVGPGERHEYTVMGPAVNLAARLMSKADTGTVIISPSTRRTVEREIAVLSLPPVMLKGLAEPVTPSLALRPRNDASRARDEGNGLQRAPLVARSSEMARCLDHSYTALNESGGVLMIVGAAGIGKTRLAQEIVVELTLGSYHAGKVQSFGIYVGDCQSYEASTPYAAVRGLLVSLLDLDTSHTFLTDGMADYIERRVQRLAPSMARFVPLLGDLLGMPLPDTALTAQMPAEQRHDRAHELVEALLRGRIGSDGMLLVIDDLHWADPSSLELLARLARSASDMRLLIVCCHRQNESLNHSWSDLPNLLRIELGELPPEGANTLAEALLGGTPPPELASLLDRTQGNPFFIEEMLRELLAAHSLLRDTSGAWRLARPLDSLALPDSIEGVLTAQIDRLADTSRELVQVAAVIGRRFLYRVLNGIYEERSILESGLRQLTDSEVILAEEIERELAYLFRHTLVRDVAYESILYARRRELHRRVAERIILLYGPEAPDQIPLLARHYLLAEDWPKAFQYHWLAGCAAQRRYANREALDMFARALSIEPNLDPPQPRRVIDIWERRGTISLLIGQYDDALSAFQQALALLHSSSLGDNEQNVRLHRHIAATYEQRADFDAAFEWLERGIGQTNSDSLNERARCFLLRAGLLQRQGKLHECLEWAERGLQLAEAIESAADQAKAYKLLGGTFCSLGDLDRAIEPSERCLEFYTSVGNLQEQAGAHINLGNISYDLGHWDAARNEYEQAVRLTNEIGNSYEQALAANNLGEVLRSQGDAAGAITQYKQALIGWQHSPFHSALLAMNLGAAFIQQGDFNEAHQQLDQSAALFEQAGADSFLAELLRYRAELALALDDPSTALAFCTASIQLAQQQDAPLEEARSQRLLGQIQLHKGEIADAIELLTRNKATFQELNTSFDSARTGIWLADARLREGDRTAGQTLLHDAIEVLNNLGARYDLARAYDVAARHGIWLEASIAH